jgi:NSS family neurotransmitter:Na+ symporter
MSAREQFGSRWGLVLATLGMAVGTGNIWRFPRIVASNGGGSFLVAWVVFLLIWSVPLMMAEFAFGKRTRKGTIGAISELMGRRFGWMGGWAALCATAIGFYYSVVAGWCVRFLWASVTGELRTVDSETLWKSFTSSPYQPVVTHLIVISTCVTVVYFGVRGIERVAKILIPTLFVLVVVLAIRAVTLPGAERGLAFLFEPEWGALADYKIWLQALTQNAWDTGAGWGLILTYAVYMKAREDVPLNACLIGFGNNSVSLLAGIMVLCTVFAVNPSAQEEIVGAGNEGLTFTWMPRLFAEMPGGQFFMILFFLALTFAAITSMISMLELAARNLMDAGMVRRKAVTWIGAAVAVFGLPSALSLEVFANQDWVWGVGLMLSGLFFALAARKFGLEKLRTEDINGEGSDMNVGRWWSFAVGVLVPVQAVVLMVWWLWSAYRDNPDGWLDLFSSYSVGTVIVQWAIGLTALILYNRWRMRQREAA